MGLAPLEHLEWSSRLPHPSEAEPSGVDEEQLDAARFECEQELEDLEAQGESLAVRWVEAAFSLQEQRAAALAETEFTNSVKSATGPRFAAIAFPAASAKCCVLAALAAVWTWRKL